MSNLTCPVCKKIAISWWEKVNLSPISQHQCSNCGASLSVPFYSLLFVMLPFALLLLHVAFLSSYHPSLTYGLLPLAFFISLFFIGKAPLIER